MERLTIRLQCCCDKKRTFPFGIKEEPDPDSRKVKITVGCPFCDRYCSTELNENQLFEVSHYRDASLKAPTVLGQRKAGLQDLVFPTQRAEPGEEEAP